MEQRPVKQGKNKEKNEREKTRELYHVPESTKTSKLQNEVEFFFFLISVPEIKCQKSHKSLKITWYQAF